MPNITGQFGHANGTPGMHAKGAIAIIDNAVAVGQTFNQSRVNNTQFYTIDASRSNSIYGNSTTVTPLSESALILMKY